MLPFGVRPGNCRRSHGQPSADTNGTDSDGVDTCISDPGPQVFNPSIADVLKVRNLLQRKVPRGLPEELIDMIIDAAEYWPSIEQKLEEHRIIQKDCDQVLLKTVPLCYDRKSLEQDSSPTPLPHRGAHPCRKIVFNISSHDQGSGKCRDNMYEFSWTWFDIEVIHGAHTKNMYANGIEQEILDNERGQVRKHYTEEDALLLPRHNKLQSNGAHVSEMQHNIIVWDYRDDIQADSPEALEIEKTLGRGRLTLDGHEVRELEIGDSIALWARARFPGWSNHVHQASVRIYWAV
ncbi:hypothetical protein DTO013E5_480 [Penicillium roqueforti]|uniref:uncharacterized protein n=1 Tax=Penicillium roqueforti TaxID=5082 RepID=UPI00190DE4B4|nr:uncharacterized protein LCP9604111_658 [Penicillium roqueforti]KAF9253132.1 hypothetical protein LCP9604111_658 [Penicillium roqueforti]KAI1838649.1 hypothetical protein CBS147337_374 [Penicillium roqueforti]KAI2680451.1 hypothetical protein CBS147355_3431 [Penicillium roqueforti]KAI2691160.1 hypothetical protein LCP963914a_1361 [Penicillium roqueforti]KAI2706857.1 hypothetical protein CBS147372_768 [Penicillium roqueforti]